MTKKKNLQPWLEYFNVLRAYVQCGYLEVMPAQGEAYITEPALYALACADDTDSICERASRIFSVVEKLKVYSCYLNASTEGYKLYVKDQEKAPAEPASEKAVQQAAENIKKVPNAGGVSLGTLLASSFAVHVVGPDYPHTLIRTILLTVNRRWWWPFRKLKKYDVITYRDERDKTQV